MKFLIFFFRSLVTALEDRLGELDAIIKKAEAEARRKERLAFVNKSLSKSLPTSPNKKPHEKKPYISRYNWLIEWLVIDDLSNEEIQGLKLLIWDKNWLKLNHRVNFNLENSSLFTRNLLLRSNV